MTKERIANSFNVNIDKVKFTLSANGLYRYSATTKAGYYIIDNLNNTYDVVNETTNAYCKWRHDLHELELEEE